MKVLMMVNWKVAFTDRIPPDKQPPDYKAQGIPYWFFRYMNPSFDVDVVDIAAPKPIAILEMRIRFYILQTLRVLPHLRQYDLVISHGMQSGIVLALWRRLFGKGRYQHLVFDIGAFNSGRRSGRSLQIMQFASRSIDGLIYHTEIQKEYYEACHPWLIDKSMFIPFGTDAEFFSGCTMDDTHTSSHPDADNKGYILSFGKIKRDWDTLLKAYAKSDRHYRLRIIGPTNLTSNDPNVEILPSVEINELMEQIRGAVYCVLPLVSMPYSYGQMTLLQQMAMGKAVIAADVPSLSAYHADGAALWYQPENIESLSNAINRLNRDAALRNEVGHHAAIAVRDIYNEQQMAYAIERYIKNGLRPVREEYDP